MSTTAVERADIVRQLRAAEEAHITENAEDAHYSAVNPLVDADAILAYRDLVWNRKGPKVTAALSVVAVGPVSAMFVHGGASVGEAVASAAIGSAMMSIITYLVVTLTMLSRLAPGFRRALASAGATKWSDTELGKLGPEATLISSACTSMRESFATLASLSNVSVNSQSVIDDAKAEVKDLLDHIAELVSSCDVAGPRYSDSVDALVELAAGVRVLCFINQQTEEASRVRRESSLERLDAACNIAMDERDNVRAILS